MEQNSIQTLQSDQFNLSILEHGIQVSQFFLDLYNHLQFNRKLQYNWKLPAKIYDLDSRAPHFPEHAKTSADIWSKISSDETIRTLIARDMLRVADSSVSEEDIHTIKAADLETFIGLGESDIQLAISLLITGLSEIHANAEMFGDIQSTSFKIKYKQIDLRGKQIIKKLKGNK